MFYLIHFSFYKCKICGEHFSLKIDYHFHLKRHIKNLDDATISTDGTENNGKQKDLSIIQEISFGVYVLNNVYESSLKL